MTDYMADYRAAQALGHHVDCDGHMTVHRVEIEREPDYEGYRAVCVECGPLHVGTHGGKDAERYLRRTYGGHAQGVPCDGRCRDWT